MINLNAISKAFRAIPDIGITQNLRPEEAKHNRYLNIGFSLFVVVNLANVVEKLSIRDFYGKVTGQSTDKEQAYLVHFTSVPSEINSYLHAFRQNFVKSGEA